MTKAQLKAYKDHKTSTFILRFAFVCALGLNGGLALSFPIAALATFSFSALAFVVLFERNRRVYWETNTTARMDLMAGDQVIMARRVTQNSQELREIKKKAKTSKTFAKAMSKAFRSKTPANKEPRIPSSEFKFNQGNINTDAIMDVAPASPVPTPAPAPVANDEPASYYNSLSDTVVNELVNHAVQNDEIAVFIQPIMRLPEKTVRGFEVFSRVKSRPGQYIPATRYIDLAKSGNVINMIDHQLLMKCLDEVKKTAGQKRNTAFYINITSATLSNKMFMTRLLGFIKQNRTLASRLVFEIAQADFDSKSDGTAKVLRGLGQLGCTFSLDHTKTLNFDVRDLRDYRVRFVKIDAGDLTAKMDTPSKISALRSIKRKLESNGIGLIAQKIEDNATLEALKPLDLHYGQGYLFGKPGLQTGTNPPIKNTASAKVA